MAVRFAFLAIAIFATAAIAADKQAGLAPGKVFKVEIALDRTDPTLMRPAMRFRGSPLTMKMPLCTASLAPESAERCA